MVRALVTFHFVHYQYLTGKRWLENNVRYKSYRLDVSPLWLGNILILLYPRAHPLIRDDLSPLINAINI